MINSDLTTWKCSAAPGPGELFWANIRWREWERTMRNNMIWVAFALLCLFFTIPVAAIQVRAFVLATLIFAGTLICVILVAVPWASLVSRQDGSRPDGVNNQRYHHNILSIFGNYFGII